MRDEVDQLVEAWHRERADLDLAPVEVFSRIGRLARLLDRAGRGMVDRLPDPGDRRGVLVRLTAEGKSTVDAAFEELLAHERDLLAALPAADRATLATLL